MHPINKSNLKKNNKRANKTFKIPINITINTTKSHNNNIIKNTTIPEKNFSTSFLNWINVSGKHKGRCGI